MNIITSYLSQGHDPLKTNFAQKAFENGGGLICCRPCMCHADPGRVGKTPLYLAGCEIWRTQLVRHTPGNQTFQERPWAEHLVEYRIQNTDLLNHSHHEHSLSSYVPAKYQSYRPDTSMPGRCVLPDTGVSYRITSQPRQVCLTEWQRVPYQNSASL